MIALPQVWQGPSHTVSPAVEAGLSGLLRKHSVDWLLQGVSSAFPIPSDYDHSRQFAACGSFVGPVLPRLS